VQRQYKAIIEELRKRGEQHEHVCACNELGDIHAHFGLLSEATNAWNDALDLLTGTYQACTALALLWPMLTLPPMLP
jgi:hypothetical protein